MADRSLTLASIVGARPQFVKASVLSRAIRFHRTSGVAPTVTEILIHTGQHYDFNLSGTFFEQLQIPKPDFHLEVGSHSPSRQTALILERLESVLKESTPDLVVVYGDTNSTLAGALTARQAGIPLIHIEAGLRSYRRDMPEELNRVVTDQIADLLLCPTACGMENLCREDLVQRAVLVPDLMEEALAFAMPTALTHSEIIRSLDLAGPYALATVHRVENTDDPTRFEALITALEELSQHLPVILPLHPRAAKVLAGLKRPRRRSLRMIEPVSYLDMLRLLSETRMVLTDSGGLQKEAAWLNVPCLTLREETEWQETVEQGKNILCGADPARILSAAAAILDRPEKTDRDVWRNLNSRAGSLHLSHIIKYWETL